MTDVKKLRELAVKATPWPKHFAVGDTFPPVWLVDENGERHEIMNDDLIFWEAANPQAVIEILDRLERYRDALEGILQEVGTSTLAHKIAREALEGGK